METRHVKSPDELPGIVSMFAEPLAMTDTPILAEAGCFVCDTCDNCHTCNCDCHDCVDCDN